MEDDFRAAVDRQGDAKKSPTERGAGRSGINQDVLDNDRARDRAGPPGLPQHEWENVPRSLAT
jgi:hypothetical protein